jgi:hypothetical protein
MRSRATTIQTEARLPWPIKSEVNMGFWSKFGRAALNIGTQVGIPALETFVPASAPIVYRIKAAIDHHGQPFALEELIAGILREVQPLANFSPEQLPYVAAAVRVALESQQK